jgi:ribosomal protein L37AE/L43A
MTKAYCIECDEEYSSKRRALGYYTCLDCGEAAATQEAVRKSKCIAPAFNKGAYMYVTSSSMARDVGK